MGFGVLVGGHRGQANVQGRESLIGPVCDDADRRCTGWHGMGGAPATPPAQRATQSAESPRIPHPLHPPSFKGFRRRISGDGARSEATIHRHEIRGETPQSENHGGGVSA